jgi:hypothetical protein
MSETDSFLFGVAGYVEFYLLLSGFLIVVGQHERDPRKSRRMDKAGSWLDERDGIAGGFKKIGRRS